MALCKVFDTLSAAGFAVTSNRQMDMLIVDLRNRSVSKTEVLSALDWQSENLTLRNFCSHIVIEELGK